MNIGSFGEALNAMHRRHGWEYMYRQLAEECAELTKAALKMVRMANDETPDSACQIVDNYIEELADVWMMIAIARADLGDDEKAQFDKIVEEKYARMMRRMGEG